MIDWSCVFALRDDIGADGFDEVIEIFLDEADGVIDKLKERPSDADLEFDLHALKNGALTLGFDDLSQLCQHAERLAASGQAAHIDISNVIAVYDRMRAEFLRELPQKLSG